MQVKGLSIQDIMNMDWKDLNKLSAKDMRQLTSRLVSASNKRIRALAKSKRGEYSYAYQTVKQRGRMFSIRGKGLGEVRSEFAMAKGFLGMKTSKVSAWKKERTEIEKRVQNIVSDVERERLGLEKPESYIEEQPIEWSERTWEKFWESYRKYEESYGGSFAKGDSTRIQQALYEVYQSNDKRRTADFMLDKLMERGEKLYEQSQESDDPFEIVDETDEKDLM